MIGPAATRSGVAGLRVAASVVSLISLSQQGTKTQKVISCPPAASVDLGHLPIVRLYHPAPPSLILLSSHSLQIKLGFLLFFHISFPFRIFLASFLLWECDLFMPSDFYSVIFLDFCSPFLLSTQVLENHGCPLVISIIEKHYSFLALVDPSGIQWVRKKFNEKRNFLKMGKKKFRHDFDMLPSLLESFDHLTH